MRSHPKVNKRELDPVSIVDLKQAAMQQGLYIEENRHTFNQQCVYKFKGALYTFSELKNALAQ